MGPLLENVLSTKQVSPFAKVIIGMETAEV